MHLLKLPLFLTILFLPLMASRASPNTVYLVELFAGEGLSFNEYRYQDLYLEAHEFPEFTHELGAAAYIHRIADWFGIGGGAGVQYNLTGASSTYREDPTIKYLFHWIKVPLFFSLSLNRGTAIAHLDSGLYASMFLAGRREWVDEKHRENRTGNLSTSDISHDLGFRLQFCMDMEAFSLNSWQGSIGVGMGVFLEKSLIDVLLDRHEEFHAFRFGFFGILSIFPRSNRAARHK